jgi:hypothetical protein
VTNSEKQGKTMKKQGKTRKNKDPCFSLFFLVWLAAGAVSRPCQGLCQAFPQSIEKHSAKPDPSPWLIRSLSVRGRMETGRSRTAVGRRRSGCVPEDNG